MKKLLLTLLISLPLLSSAQHVFLIEDMVTTKDMSLNAIIISMTDDFDEAVDNYKDFVKDGYEYKVKKENSTTYTVEAVDLPHISTKRGDLKAYLIHTDTMNVMAFSFLLGYDVFLTSKDQPNEMKEFKKFVIDYMDYQYNAHYTVKIEEQTKLVNDLKKELEQNESKIGSLKKDVVSISKKYGKEEDETKKVELNADKQLTMNEIDNLVEVVTKSRTELTEQEKKLYAMKDELNKIHNKIISL